MSKFFLTYDSSAILYGDLIADINAACDYKEKIQEPDLYRYFLNFLVALVNDRPLTLIDSDFSKAELNSLNISGVNVPTRINAYQLGGVKELIDKVINSRSSITFYTSGTTGQPKKITHSVANLIRNVRRSEKHADDIWGFAYNPTHMAGVQVFLQALLNGNQIINLFNISKQDVLSKIKEFRISHISATPTFYRLLVPVDESFDSVTNITFGGEKSDSMLYDLASAIFPNAKIHNIYASTEAGTLFSTNGSEFFIPNSIRHLVKIVEGEIFIHSSLLGSSDSLILNNDYFATGDIVEWVDEEKGVFRFKNRKNELINAGGYKVNPYEVEDAIRTLSGVMDVHVYGKDNSVIGKILCADIVFSDNEIPTEREIRLSLSEKLQDFKIPRKIKIVEKLETTRTGKLKR